MLPAPTRVLLGPASSGRSSILNHLGHRSGGHATHLRARGSDTSPLKLLSAFFRSTGLDADGLAVDEMRCLIGVYIQERLGKGKRVVLEVDDADRLDPSVWEQIEHLLSFKTNGRQPELLMSLVHLDDRSSPAATYVREQEAPALGVVSWLEPREVSSYLHWRFERFDLAGLNTPAATRLIAKSTQGCFAAIDHIAQVTLLLMRKRSGDQMNANVVREATRLLQLQHHSQDAGRSEQSRATMMTAKVIVSEAGRVMREVRFSDRLLIGRSELNDLCVDNDYLSRHHAVIVRTDRGHYLTDLNSVNGIGMNGRPVHSTPIRDGEVFCIGPYRLKLRLTEPVFGHEDSGAADTEATADELADTAVMPAVAGETAHLKVIK